MGTGDEKSEMCIIFEAKAQCANPGTLRPALSAKQAMIR